jgi:SRSO17 transposase
VPQDRRDYRTKPEIALVEIDRIRAAGVRFGCVLADAGYGLSALFRQGLSERSLTWGPSTCLAKKSGSSVSIALPESGNTTCPTCRQTPR